MGNMGYRATFQNTAYTVVEIYVSNQNHVNDKLMEQVWIG